AGGPSGRIESIFYFHRSFVMFAHGGLGIVSIADPIDRRDRRQKQKKHSTSPKVPNRYTLSWRAARRSPMSGPISPLASPFPALPPVAGVRVAVTRAGYKAWERTDLTYAAFEA